MGRRDIWAALTAALVSTLPAVLSAVDTVPAGAEFQVNSYTTFTQVLPSVAGDAAGNFVAVWESIDQDGDGAGAFGQRFASGGTRLGSEFQVPTSTVGDQFSPSVASDAVGSFVAVWAADDQDGDDSGVFGQRFGSGGARLGSEFMVNSYTIGYQERPVVARNSAGDFVVVWSSDLQDGDDVGIFGQRFASSGLALGSEFMVNSFTVGNQNYPSLATDMMGNFVVAWQSFSQDGQSYGIFGQRFASGGAPLGTEFQINTYFTGTQVAASVASDAVGNFVVAWQSANQDQSQSGIFAQRFANDGDPLGGEFQVNTYTPNAQGGPAIFRENGGRFVVAWDSFQQDGSSLGVFGQRFAASGAKLGSEFQVNSFTPNVQADAVIAGTANQFVILWDSQDQDGSDFGIFGQRFALARALAPVPAASHGLLLVLGGALAALGWRRLRRRPTAHRDPPHA